MQFYIHRNGQQLGPFSADQVRSHLLSGTFSSTDLAWHEGASGWAPLTSFPDIVGPTRPGIANPPDPFSRPVLGSQNPETSGLAVASLVLGILSFFTIGLTAIPAIICGHVSLSQIKKAAGRISGQGLAIGGLATGYFGACLIAVMIFFVFLGIAMPVFATVNERGLAIKCLSQAKQIATACKLYAMDHKGDYPQNLDQLVPDYLPDRQVFLCPMNKKDVSIGYDYFGGKDTDPPDKILLKSKMTTTRHQRIVVTSDGSGTLKRD
jgi:hypothetical protein